MNRIPRSGADLRHFAFYISYLSALLLFVVLASETFAANRATGVDAVLLMDSSGSMAKNDPHKLRVPAAKLFMSLLGSDDRIGLVSFSDNGYPVLHLTAPGPDTDNRILAAADKVSSKGVYTNLHAALLKGVAMLDQEGRAGREKMLVLMSDGKMDVGDSDEDQQLAQQLQGELLESIRQKQIKVYTIAFTEASDVELLQTVAGQTGALFKLARSDTDLHTVFSDIFETAKSPDMLPIEGGQFAVDASIEEVTIVASKEREDVRIFLQAPDGRKLGADDAGEQLKWFMSEHFDMVTVHNPQPGDWKLLFSAGNSRAYIVTNMALEHNPQQAGLRVGADMVLESWLSQDGKLLDREAVLSNTTFRMKIQAPGGAAADFELFDTGEYGDRQVADGIYSNTLAYENPGTYRIDIIAEGATFKRQKTVHFEVAPASAVPATPVVTPAAVAPQPVLVPALEVPSELRPEAEAVAPEARPQADAAVPDEGVPAAQKKGVNLGLAVGIFVGMNVLLGLTGFGVWWLIKKRKQQAAVAAQEDAADEVAAAA